MTTPAAAPEQGGATTPSRTSSTSVRAIVSTVTQLLTDYAVQLRDDVGPLKADIDVKDEDDAVHGASHRGKLRENATDAAGFASGETEKREEEVPQLTEADMAECRERLRRLQRIRRVLVQFDLSATSREKKAALSISSTSTLSQQNGDKGLTEDVSETVRRNPVLTVALSRFARMSSRFRNIADSSQEHIAFSIKTEEERCTSASSSALGLRLALPTAQRVRPLLKAVLLQEGALAAFSRNIGIVFRRRPLTSSGGTTISSNGAHGARADPQHSQGLKREREADGHAEAAVVNYWAKLSAQQRKARFAIYTLRAALLPRVNRICAPFYVSPAVEELARLNAAAERFMVERAWTVHTKMHLLREAPLIAHDVALCHQALRETLNKSLSPAQQDACLEQVRYAEFVATDGGVVRLRIQNALYVDVTYDLRRRQWALLGTHWSLLTTPAGASLLASDPTTAEQAGLGASLLYIQPQNRDALHTFLQRAFAQDGLSGGLRAANRLVCAVVLDTLATQLQGLQHTFFTHAGSGLARWLETEVRPGTFISLHFALAEALQVSNTLHLARDAPKVVHVKVAVCGSTVVMERVVGTDLTARVVTLLLGLPALRPAEGACAKRIPHVIVDMEALLWQCMNLTT